MIPLFSKENRIIVRCGKLLLIFIFAKVIYLLFVFKVRANQNIQDVITAWMTKNDAIQWKLYSSKKNKRTIRRLHKKLCSVGMFYYLNFLLCFMYRKQLFFLTNLGVPFYKIHPMCNII